MSVKTRFNLVQNQLYIKMFVLKVFLQSDTSRERYPTITNGNYVPGSYNLIWLVENVFE